MRNQQLKKLGFRSYALFAAAFFFLASFFFVSTMSTVNSLAWYGRTDHSGYFDNQKESGYIPEYTSCGHKAPVLPNRCYAADALPGMSNVGQYYNYLHTIYDNGTAYGDGLSPTKSLQWTRTGVAFIVNAMLGRSGADAHRGLTAADWSAFQSRLNFIATYGSVDFNASMDVLEFGGLNTFYQYNHNDISNLTQTSSERQTGIRFSYGGKTVFAIFYKCANPLGNLPGLPDTNFNLTPTTTVTPTVVQPGDPVTSTGIVNNTGATTSTSAAWRLVTFNLTSGQAVPTAGTGAASTSPESYYGHGATKVSEGSKAFPKGVTNPLTRNSTTVPDLALGSKVCFALSVRPYNQSTTNWRYGTPVCVKVGKEPKVQVTGGDLRVGSAFSGTYSNSKIETSVTVRSAQSYGSWDEYAIIAAGTVKGAASASGYSNGISCTSNCATNNLSLANQGSTIGNYKPTTPLPDVAASFPVTSTTPAYSSLADASLRRVEKANGNITITGGTINKGDWLVINAPTRTVTITGDINYANVPLASNNDIPQLVIIANQINIENSVKNIDAWLIASGSTGTINTCTKSGTTTIGTTTQLSASLCQNPLTINGPVMAKKLYLRRTGGADKTSSAVAAEVINLRPDAYLWGLARAGSSPKLTTISTKELPPRF